MNGRFGVIVILCLAATVGLCSCSSEGAVSPRGGVSTELEIELTDPYWRQLYPQHWPGCFGAVTSCRAWHT